MHISDKQNKCYTWYMISDYLLLFEEHELMLLLNGKMILLSNSDGFSPKNSEMGIGMWLA